MIFFIFLTIILGIVLFFIRLGTNHKTNKAFEIIKQTSKISVESKRDFLYNKFKHLLMNENDKKEVGSVINIGFNCDIVNDDVVWKVEKEEITKLDILVGDDTKWIEIYKVLDKDLDKIIQKENG